MNEIVAERVFRDANSGAPVTARIFAPQSIGESEWSCKITIEGLETPYERSIIGVDSFQALFGGLRVLCAQLEKQEPSLAFLDGPRGDCALPLIISWSYRPSLRAEASRLVQE